MEQGIKLDIILEGSTIIVNNYMDHDGLIDLLAELILNNLEFRDIVIEASEYAQAYMLEAEKHDQDIMKNLLNGLDVNFFSKN